MPIHIPIIILAAITPGLRNRKILTAVITFVIVVILQNWLKLDWMFLAFSFASIYLIIQIFDYVVVKSAYFSKSLSIKSYSLFFGHLGFGLLVLSISLNTSLSKEVEFIGKIGQKVKQQGFVVKLENIRFADSNNYFRQIAEFSIEDQDNNIVILQPENRLYKN